MLQNYFYRAGLQSREKRNGQGIKNYFEHVSKKICCWLSSIPTVDDKFLFEYVCRKIRKCICNFLNDLLILFCSNLTYQILLIGDIRECIWMDMALDLFHKHSLLFVSLKFFFLCQTSSWEFLTQFFMNWAWTSVRKKMNLFQKDVNAVHCAPFFSLCFSCINCNMRPASSFLWNLFSLLLRLFLIACWWCIFP